MSSISIDKNCNNVHLLRAEITLLKKTLGDKQAELNAMRARIKNYEEEFYQESDRLIAWQDKFERLYESHKKVQKINQNLEDKLLKLVDRNSGERAQLTSDCATLNIRLSQANYNISALQREIERYKQDINLAIQLLHCKPDNFLPQKINSLPLEIQSKVAAYMKLDSETESGVGSLTKGKYQILPTDDETQFSVGLNSFDQNKNGEMQVSPLVVAKYLENELKSKNPKHCETCSCATKNLIEIEGIQFNAATQTDFLQQCLRCKSNSPSHTNSPYLIKLKSTDSVISETKSSVSDFTNLNDKAFTPSKIDDLKVNPILGHHRLCEHTKIYNYQCYSQKDEELIKINEHVVEIKQKLNEEKPSLSHGAGNGSNNSLWSKTSSKEGAKLFENFNRNLIKTIRIRSENPRKLAPRICALKIQDDNILLDDSQYTRRPRLLDEELLDEEKDISGSNLPMNFLFSQPSTILSSSANQNEEIFSTNKTDSEKFNEIQSKEEVTPAIIKPEVKPIIVNECETMSFMSPEDNDSILCRRQNQMNCSDKYSRVAEWVANSKNIPLPNSPQQITDNLNNQKEALDFKNNNNNPVHNQMYNGNISLREIEPAQNSTNELNESSVDALEQNNSLSTKKDELVDEKINLAQMEYNVKKFLLKQNEWANNQGSNDSSSCAASEEIIFVKTPYQRTETNL